MIKVAELRIGNWVKVGSNESTVCLIDHNSFIQLLGNVIVNRPEHVEPILLTPERLEKCGFEEIYKSDFTIAMDYKTNKKFSVRWNLVNGKFQVIYDNVRLSHIKFLHQLQNIYFALTNQELIMNFKYKNMQYKISYAVYGYNLEQPLERFDNSEEAHADLINCDDGIMVVTELCEYDNNGKLIIKKERVREAPMIWLPTTFMPDYDGHFLCWVSVKEECGAVSERAEVVWYAFGQWNTLPNRTVKQWMIIKKPVSVVIQINK